MAYIPTIHTYEDDINENRGLDQAPIVGGVENINKNNILVAERPKSSLSKKIITFIAVLFILGSVLILGYYLYGKWQNKLKENQLNENAQNQQTQIQNQQNVGVESDLSKILPLLAPGIQKYVASAVKKNNIIILTLNDNNLNGIDNYSSIYGYILAHKNDLNNDLFFTFNISDLIQDLSSNNGLDDSYNQNIVSTDTSKTATTSFIAKPIPIKAEDLVWENKSLNNNDFEVANAGVINFIYGYSLHKYLILTTSLKNFFDTINNLNS